MVESYANYEFFINQDLSEYSDKWIAIIDKKVVASGKNINQIIKEVQIKYPHKRPLITRIKDKLSIL